jgi:hypothetical protein
VQQDLFSKSNIANNSELKMSFMESKKFSDYWSRNWLKYVLGVVVIIILGVIAFWIWYANWVNFVENYEYGFRYNKFTGQITEVKHTGWVVVTPWEENVHHIDTRPYQVSISANARILNAKLVRFNPAGINTFIEWHGRAAGDNVEKLKEILKCYAFDRDEGRDCPFLTVVSVLAPNQGTVVDSIPVKK